MDGISLRSWYVWLVIDAHDMNQGARFWRLAQSLKEDLLYLYVVPTQRLYGFVLHVRAESKENAEASARHVAYQGLVKAGMAKRSVTLAEATPGGESSASKDPALFQ